MWPYQDKVLMLEGCEPLRLHAGAGDSLYRNKKKGNIAIDLPNKAWRPPNTPKDASTDSEEALDEEDEAWLETVNMHAAAAGQQ